MKNINEFSNKVIVKDFIFNSQLHRIAILRETVYKKGSIEFTGNFNCVLIVENEGTRFGKLNLAYGGGQLAFIEKDLAKQIFNVLKHAVDSSSIGDSPVELNMNFPYYFTIKEFTLKGIIHTMVVIEELYPDDDGLDFTGSFDCMINSTTDGLRHFMLAPRVDDSWVCEDGDDCPPDILVALDAIIKEKKGKAPFDLESVEALIATQRLHELEW